MRTGVAINRAGEITVELYWTQHRRAGRRLLLINGLGSPLVAFEPGFVAAFVGRGFTVARFDNRDVGRSSRVSGHRPGQDVPYSIGDMAGDAVAVLDAIGWPSAHVLGQSMGGMIAQQAAIDHPTRVESLISVMSSTGERGYGRSSDEAASAVLRPAPREPEAWLDHRVATERVWASSQWWDEDWVRAKGRAMLDHGVDPEGSIRQFRSVVAAGSRDAALADLTVPTLVVHGGADPLIGPDAGRHTAAVIPAARYVEIDGLGHDLPPQVWPRLVDEVDRLVSGSPLPGTG